MLWPRFRAMLFTDPPYLVGFRDRQGRTIAGDKTDEWLQPACNEQPTKFFTQKPVKNFAFCPGQVRQAAAVMPLAAKVLKKMMGAENINRRRHIMAVRGINKVILVGRLGKDPEVRYIPNGGAVANLQVATSEIWRDKQTGEMREQTEWHRVVLFGKLAEVAGEYLRKGEQVYIEGQLRTRSWEDNGITRYVTEILVKTTGTMQMLGRAAGAQTQPEEGQQFSGQSQPEPQAEAGTKKGGAKTKGRGRKVAQPEPQPPSEPEYNFDDDIPF